MRYYDSFEALMNEPIGLKEFDLEEQEVQEAEEANFLWSTPELSIKERIIEIISEYTDVHFCISQEVLEGMDLDEILKILSELLEHMKKELQDFIARFYG